MANPQVRNEHLHQDPLTAAENLPSISMIYRIRVVSSDLLSYKSGAVSAVVLLTSGSRTTPWLTSLRNHLCAGANARTVGCNSNNTNMSTVHWLTCHARGRAAAATPRAGHAIRRKSPWLHACKSANFFEGLSR